MASFMLAELQSEQECSVGESNIHMTCVQGQWKFEADKHYKWQTSNYEG